MHIYTEGAVQTTRAGSPQPGGRDPSEQTLSTPPHSHRQGSSPIASRLQAQKGSECCREPRDSSPSRPQGSFPTELSKQGST